MKGKHKGMDWTIILAAAGFPPVMVVVSAPPCSEDGKARSYVWLSPVEVNPNNTIINVSEENC